MKAKPLFFAVVMLLTGITTSHSQVPQLINYQGILTEPATGNPLSGTFSMVFSIYSVPTGGTALFAETQSVTATNGLFNVLLGNVTPLPFTVFSGGDRFLGIKVGNDAEMTPRKRMVSVGYSFMSDNADKVDGFSASATPTANRLFPLGADAKFPLSVLPPGLPTGPHASTHNAGGADPITVTTALIADGAVTSAKIRNGAVTNEKIADGAVIPGKLALPFFASVSRNTDLFSLTNTGTGRAGLFEINNPSSVVSALRGATDGGGAAVSGSTTGTGIAAFFEINNTRNTNPTLDLETNGSGAALLATNAGTGRAAILEINNALNTREVLNAKTIGTGHAGIFEITNSNNSNNALQAITNGTGSALFASTTGSGFAGDFRGRVVVSGNVGIGVNNPTNILTVERNSTTDPIADRWTEYSSRRWKTNIEPLAEALDKVQHLRGVSYDWKADGKHDIGLIAEEVGEVMPEVVEYEENGKDAKAVNYARLVAVLIEAIKEQQKEIVALKATVSSLSAPGQEISPGSGGR